MTPPPPTDHHQTTTSPPHSDLISLSPTEEMSRTLLPHLASSLKSFTSSSSSFRILYTHPPTHQAPSSALPLEKLYVLDSSFNPPSKAHGWLAKDAVLSEVNRRETQGRNWEGIRLLLLLATQNADKPSKPVGFEERVAMMVLMARSLYAELLEAERARLNASKPSNIASENSVDQEQAAGGGDGNASLGMFAIDVGVIKQPYFVDKAAAIEESGVYGDKGRFEQTHLTGYDTLMRIFDKKYYGEKGLSVLAPFLERGRIRAVLRPGKDWGDLEMQREWGKRVRSGQLEGEGLRREWRQRVELVEDKEAIVGGVSSTKVREGVERGDWEGVEELVGTEVMEWIRERSLYVKADRAKV